MKPKEIGKDFGLKVISVTKRNVQKIVEKYEIENIEDLKNNAYVIGDEDIILGLYDDEEVKMAAFFHEVGHTIIKPNFEKLVNNDEMLIEFQAWIEGLKVAKKYGYKFSDKTFEYILRSLNSYYKDAVSVYNKKTKKCLKKLVLKSNTTSRIRKILPNLT
jgi:HD superfamily phosphohydrolase